jgi:hypothetical protein
MTEYIFVPDTGALLPFLSIELPTSKKKLIDILLEHFKIYIPNEVAEEMERPKGHLEDWAEISLTWDRVKKDISYETPPDSCFKCIAKEDPNFHVENSIRIPAEYKVAALGLYLSRCMKRPIIVAVHEKKAFTLLNHFFRKQQCGCVFSPFDVLVFIHVYMDIAHEEVDYAWRELCAFPGINLILGLRPAKYDNNLEVCLLNCSTKNVEHRKMVKKR